MSTGLCGDHCQGSYAFAVVQGNACWCSNYVPVDQEDTYSCSSGCPGITSEWCGNTESGLYGYFALPGGKPLGTSGSGSSNNAPSTSSSVSTTRSSGSSPIPSSSRAPSSSVWYSSRPSPASLVTVVPPQESVQTVAPSSVFSHSPDSTSQVCSSSRYCSLSHDGGRGLQRTSCQIVANSHVRPLLAYTFHHHHHIRRHHHHQRRRHRRRRRTHHSAQRHPHHRHRYPQKSTQA